MCVGPSGTAAPDLFTPGALPGTGLVADVGGCAGGEVRIGLGTVEDVECRSCAMAGFPGFLRFTMMLKRLMFRAFT